MYIGLIDQLKTGGCERHYGNFINTIRTQLQFHADRFPDRDKALDDLLRTANEIDSILALSRLESIQSDQLQHYLSIIQPLIDAYESDLQDKVVPDKISIVMRPSIGNIAIKLGLYFQFYRNERYEAATALLIELTKEWEAYQEWLKQKRGQTLKAKQGGHKKAENLLDKNKDVYEEVKREFATGKYVKGGKGGKSLSDLAKAIYHREVNNKKDAKNEIKKKVGYETIYDYVRDLNKNK